jgi:hypothetical protein
MVKKDGLCCGKRMIVTEYTVSSFCMKCGKHSLEVNEPNDKQVLEIRINPKR